ncbi:MAG: phenylalanine--tRNA ligase subunit beta [Armatimonadota bacterium]
MRVSVDWLREYVDFDCPPSELAVKLTMAGLEVEESRELTARDFADMGGSGEKGDVIWDTKVTPNRGDWLSMIGTAREVGAVVGARMRMPEPKVREGDPPASESVRISILDPDLCRRYVGVLIRGAEVRESPGWLKDRVIAAGMRPINNVVDVTNYVMFELGQPLHAFDFRLLHGGEIIVRRARPGETIVSIDGVERRLEPDMLVIADADRAVAIAGIMGGYDSEISDLTQDILVESANFNCTSVRRTSKRLGMVTESSYRFERGVDPSITDLAALRAAQLIQHVAGGEVARGIVDVYPRPVQPITLEVRPDRVNAILGTSIEPAVMARCLESLEIETDLVGGVLRCVVPTFRPDISREIDLIEEIGRVYGYDNLPMTLPARSLQGRDSPEGVFSEKLRRILISSGCQEALTHSLTDSRLAELAGKADQVLRVRNPLSDELDSMRAALAPNLLQVIARNQAFGSASLAVFEIGKIYGLRDGEIWEKRSLAAAMVGELWKSAWSLPAEALTADFFWCKGMVEGVLEGLSITGASFAPVRDPLLHPTRAAKVSVEGRDIGLLGEVSPEVVEFFEIKGRPCVFELDFEALMELAPESPSYRPLPRYPALYRHLAVVAREDIAYEEIRNVVLTSGGPLIEKVSLLDVYKGPQIGPDQRSLTLSMVFRSPEKTLTDDEVNAIVDRVREALGRDLGATFR